MDRSDTGWTQARAHRRDYEVVESQRPIRDHESVRWNKSCSFADAGSVGRTGLACGRVAGMRVATGEQFCKRQRFVFSCVGKKAIWCGMQLDRNARSGTSSVASDPKNDAQVYDARLHSTRLMGINVLSFRHRGLCSAFMAGGRSSWRRKRTVVFGYHYTDHLFG